MSTPEGTFDDAKGRVKEAAGALADDEELKNEGRLDRTAGALKNKAGELKDKVEDAVDAVKDKISGDDRR